MMCCIDTCRSEL